MTVQDLNNIPALMSEMDAILQRVAKTVGDYLEGKILDMITKQWPEWEPLSPVTIRRKKSSKAWIDTSKLFGEITHRVLNDGAGKTVEIGIFDSDRGYIARCLEFGTSNSGGIVAGGVMHQWNKTKIPERPLFRLVFDLEEENVINLIVEEFNRELERFLI